MPGPAPYTLSPPVPQPNHEPAPVSAAQESGSLSCSQSFSDIVHNHSGYVFRVLRFLGVRDADVEDMCQETFIIVHRKLPSYEPRAELRTWIYAIALRVVSDYHKRAYRKREKLVERLPELRIQAPQEQSLEQRQEWELLEKLLRTLSDEQRQVFVLYEIEALTMREIAQIVGSPLQTIYSRLQVARKQVESQLARLRMKEALP